MPGEAQRDVLAIPLDRDRIREVIRGDIAGFMADIDAPRLTEEMEMRQFAVVFWARFLPEVFDDETRQRLESYMVEMRARPDYSYKWYHRCFHLCAALYALTHCRTWLLPVLLSAGQGGSEGRRLAINALVLVADQVNLCDDADFLRSVRGNLESWHLYSDLCIVLLAACGATRDAREDCLQVLLDTYEPDSCTAQTLKAFTSGEYVNNPLCSVLLKVASYTTCRLAAFSPHQARTLTLSPEFPDAHELHRRVRAHSLAPELLSLSTANATSKKSPSSTRNAAGMPLSAGTPDDVGQPLQGELPLASRFVGRDKVNPDSEVARWLQPHFINILSVYGGRGQAQSSHTVDSEGFMRRVFECEFEESGQPGLGCVVSMHGADSRALEVAAEYVFVSAMAGGRRKDWNLLARHKFSRGGVHYDRLTYERIGGDIEHVTFIVAGEEGGARKKRQATSGAEGSVHR